MKTVININSMVVTVYYQLADGSLTTKLSDVQEYKAKNKHNI
jgi:hypothetical protein